MSMLREVSHDRRSEYLREMGLSIGQRHKITNALEEAMSAAQAPRATRSLLERMGVARSYKAYKLWALSVAPFETPCSLSVADALIGLLP